MADQKEDRFLVLAQALNKVSAHHNSYRGTCSDLVTIQWNPTQLNKLKTVLANFKKEPIYFFD